VAALKPIVDGLVSRGLMVELSPPGRGQMVSHALAPPGEIVTAPAPAPVSRPAAAPAMPAAAQSLDALRSELAELRERIARLEARLDDRET
jgi:uncharacterized protein YceH (UPF0502 family)